jgi:hypothetical protein
MKNRSISSFILHGVAGLALVGMTACTGGKKDEVAYATKLEYSGIITDDYRLETDKVRSTDKKLVLELWGPTRNTQLTGRGVFFGLKTDPSMVAFAKVDASDTELAQNEIFELGPEPRLLKGVVNGTDTLNVLISQKGHGNGQRVNQVLARVALEFHSTSVPSGTKIPLAMTEALLLPYDSGSSTPITVSVGTLTAR